jgi:hypothetical protein
MKAWFSGLWGNQQAVVEPATLRDATALCQIHSASFHRGWGESEFETMLTERNTLVDRLRMRPTLATSPAGASGRCFWKWKKITSRRAGCIAALDLASWGAGKAITGKAGERRWMRC